MEFETAYQYSTQFVKKAFRCYMWRSSLGFHIGMFLVCVLGLYLLSSGGRIGFGDFCLGVAAYYFYGWWDAARRSVGSREKVQNQDIRLGISEEVVKFEGWDFSSAVKWTGIAALWKFKELWLLCFDRSGYYLAVPVSSLSDSAKALIEQKISENKGRVV